MGTRVVHFCDVHEDPWIPATHINLVLQFGKEALEVDLCDECYESLHRPLKPYLDAARPVQAHSSKAQHRARRGPPRKGDPTVWVTFRDGKKTWTCIHCGGDYHSTAGIRDHLRAVHNDFATAVSERENRTVTPKRETTHG